MWSEKLAVLQKGSSSADLGQPDKTTGTANQLKQPEIHPARVLQPLYIIDHLSNTNQGIEINQWEVEPFCPSPPSLPARKCCLRMFGKVPRLHRGYTVLKCNLHGEPSALCRVLSWTRPSLRFHVLHPAQHSVGPPRGGHSVFSAKLYS